jgi:hypothetical protein
MDATVPRGLDEERRRGTEEPEAEGKARFRVIVVGDAGCGREDLLTQILVNRTFDRPSSIPRGVERLLYGGFVRDAAAATLGNVHGSVGVEFEMQCASFNIKAPLRTAAGRGGGDDRGAEPEKGQQQQEEDARALFRGAHAVVFAFRAEDPASLENLTPWLELYRELLGVTSSDVRLLVKTVKTPEVSADSAASSVSSVPRDSANALADANAFADANEMIFLDVSANGYLGGIEVLQVAQEEILTDVKHLFAQRAERRDEISPKIREYFQSVSDGSSGTFFGLGGMKKKGSKKKLMAGDIASSVRVVDSKLRADASYEGLDDAKLLDMARVLVAPAKVFNTYFEPIVTGAVEKTTTEFRRARFDAGLPVQLIFIELGLPESTRSFSAYRNVLNQFVKTGTCIPILVVGDVVVADGFELHHKGLCVPRPFQDCLDIWSQARLVLPVGLMQMDSVADRLRDLGRMIVKWNVNPQDGGIAAPRKFVDEALRSLGLGFHLDPPTLNYLNAFGRPVDRCSGSNLAFRDHASLDAKLGAEYSGGTLSAEEVALIEGIHAACWLIYFSTRDELGPDADTRALQEVYKPAWDSSNHTMCPREFDLTTVVGPVNEVKVDRSSDPAPSPEEEYKRDLLRDFGDVVSFAEIERIFDELQGEQSKIEARLRFLQGKAHGLQESEIEVAEVVASSSMVADTFENDFVQFLKEKGKLQGKANSVGDSGEGTGRGDVAASTSNLVLREGVVGVKERRALIFKSWRKQHIRLFGDRIELHPLEDAKVAADAQPVRKILLDVLPSYAIYKCGRDELQISTDAPRRLWSLRCTSSDERDGWLHDFSDRVTFHQRTPHVIFAEGYLSIQYSQGPLEFFHKHYFQLDARRKRLLYFEDDNLRPFSGYGIGVIDLSDVRTMEIARGKPEVALVFLDHVSTLRFPSMKKDKLKVR